ncbi:lytic transglycosylase domain-containing protein [Ectobacillus sp. JY-23]|uniref:lytic transglycosylase domain-containing protein n=1 Tax=Ectobacillus sp. JY-23 TaxID=2933872 RepID=UPI001FF687CD|nr:lytic transglycosylase domain-containing protein [Ectobacillus sp. JY-23]UOY93372.1 lytic transglycosylase domain-containing protein [Ectobacillus sp. JY-23]
MIENIVTTFITNKKMQFEQKMSNPLQFVSNAKKQAFQAELETAIQAEQVAQPAVKQTMHANETESVKEYERRFSIAPDTWKVGNKYNIQSINPKYENMYIDIIKEMGQKYGVPVKLIQKMIETESHFRPNTVSHAGARGLMQLMPVNIREHGVTDPYDPRQNIEAGVKEISGYLKQYKGDLILSLAAYNAGPGNVRKYGGVPPFRETENYIKKILNVDVRA